MDNNNPTSAQPGPTNPQPSGVAGPAQPTPATPPVTPNMAQVGTPPPGGNKKIMLIVAGVALIILLAGVVFWYMNKQQSAKIPATESVKTTPQPTLSQLINTLDQSLNSINVEAADSDLAPIDQDLQSL